MTTQKRKKTSKKPNFSHLFQWFICKFISSRFFENQPNEICRHLSEKASKGRCLQPEKLQNHSNEGKGKEKKKERGKGKEEKKKSNSCTLSFYNSHFGDNFWPKKLFYAKGSFGDNVIKNPARYICICKCYPSWRFTGDPIKCSTV